MIVVGVRRACALLSVILAIGLLASCRCDRRRPTEAAAVAPDPRMKVAVDRRVELLSLLCHLAGADEYRGHGGPYLRAVHEWFAPFANHRAVVATRKLRSAHGVSHDAPMTLAVQLDASMHPLTDLSLPPPGLDDRFAKVDLDAYLEDVRAFATESGFDRFLEQQAPYVREVERRFEQFLGDKPILRWFDATLWPRENTHHLIAPGLLTGGWNYGVRGEHGGTLEVLQVMFLENPDASGLPRPGLLTHTTLVHELAHTYVNPTLDPQVASMPEADTVFASVAPAMAAQGYRTLRHFVDESVVRALVVLYLRDRLGEDEARRELDEETTKRSFVRTAALVRALDERRKKQGRLAPDDLVAAAREALR